MLADSPLPRQPLIASCRPPAPHPLSSRPARFIFPSVASDLLSFRCHPERGAQRRVEGPVFLPTGFCRLPSLSCPFFGNRMGFTLCPLTHCLITLRCDPRPFHPIFHPPNLVARAKEGEWLSPGRRHPDTAFIVEETRRLRPVVCGTLHRSATHLIFPASVRPFAHPSNSFVLKNLPVSCSFQRPNLQNSSYSLENREFTGGEREGVVLHHNRCKSTAHRQTSPATTLASSARKSKHPAKLTLLNSHGQKWIRITIIFINDMRTICVQVIDSKHPRIASFHQFLLVLQSA